MILKLFYIGLGGFIGALGRYLLSAFVHYAFPNTWYPYGTFVVNIIGCLLIGLVLGMDEGRQMLSPDLRLLIVIGILGGFTTFSSYMYESLGLLRNEQIIAGLTNIIAQPVFGMLAVAAGFYFGRTL